ncbi:hypothetical protein ENUP19_0041G0086 [Entamoeba nuttalli]|uniref:DNA replication factor Dna2 protein n=2 Tax=Entamoeba nuttalli TaxID=412467 RepID=K2HW98_ENTNP|nr:DNA replication factor Dna2 protein [Entamoeba nuttalli P19]EKE40540.1 DNA replication factor Dna2 protein [Entamoeba nuttalli P19]|eukprot:XP_008857128.1 DNA replication factor Dna2 protein [Entamoeba nuttalli P19]
MLVRKKVTQKNWNLYIRCEVVALLDDEKNLKRYKVEEQQEKKQFILYLDDLWYDTSLKVGDFIHLIFLEERTKNSLPNPFILNNRTPILLIQNPDYLINTTSTVSSTWCNRQTVIKNYLFLDDYYEATTLGTLIHGTIQHILITNPPEFNKTIFKSMIEELSEELLTKIYVLGITRKEFIDHAMEFYDTVNNWYQCWKTKTIKTSLNREIHFSEFIASEPQIQSQIFGFKGAIDILLNDSEGEIIVEMKTGKQKEENFGQIAYYFLLLSGFLQKPHHQFRGLLNYVHRQNNNFVQVVPTVPQLVAITQLRNSLAVYSKNMTIPNEDECIRREISCKYCQITEHCGLICENDGINYNKSAIQHLNSLEKAFYFKYLNDVRLEMKRIETENQKRWLFPNEVKSIGRRMKLIKSECTMKFPDYYIYTFEGECIYDESLICVSTEDGKINIIKGYMLPFEDNDIISEEKITDCDQQNSNRSIISEEQGIEQIQEIRLKRVKIRTPQRIIISTLSLFKLDKFSGTNALQVSMTTVGKLMRNDDDMKRIRDFVINSKPCPVINFNLDLSQTQNIDDILNEDENNGDDDLDWILDKLNISEQTLIQKQISEKDDFLLNSLSSSQEITPITGLSSNMILSTIETFCSKTHQRVFVTASNQTVLDKLYDVLPKEKTLRLSTIDDLLHINPVIETVINEHPIVLGSFRESSKKITQAMSFDIAIIADAINVNVVQSLNVFYLTKTVWLFEGEKISHLNETSQIENQSIFSLMSRTSQYSMSTLLDKEYQLKQIIDIEDLGDIDDFL